MNLNVCGLFCAALRLSRIISLLKFANIFAWSLRQTHNKFPFSSNLKIYNSRDQSGGASSKNKTKHTTPEQDYILNWGIEKCWMADNQFVANEFYSCPDSASTILTLELLFPEPGGRNLSELYLWLEKPASEWVCGSRQRAGSLTHSLTQNMFIKLKSLMRARFSGL